MEGTIQFWNEACKNIKPTKCKKNYEFATDFQ